MKKIGLFYGANADKTALVAEKIRKEFGSDITVIPVEHAWEQDFTGYENMIVGASTWFDGELPTYWDELLPELRSLDLKGKKVAIFGLGDQVNYPDNFVDGIGLLAKAFEEAGAAIVGYTSTNGYTFNKSQALTEHSFCGLALDLDNQPEKTDARIKEWCDVLKKEFS